MAKMQFHTLSFVNDLRTGKVGKRITVNTIRKENDMTNYKRNERNPNDGTGVPDMPKLNFGNQRPDPLEQLKVHMTTKYGQVEGLKLLRAMTAEEAIRTLEQIKDNKQETGIAYKKGDFEAYSMPKINFKRR